MTIGDHTNGDIVPPLLAPYREEEIAQIDIVMIRDGETSHEAFDYEEDKPALPPPYKGDMVSIPQVTTYEFEHAL